MSPRRASFSDAVVESVTRLVGERLEYLESCLALSVAALCDAEGIAAAGVSVFDARTGQFEVDIATRAGGGSVQRWRIGRAAMEPVVECTAGDDVLLLQDVPLLEPWDGALRPFFDAPADARIFVPLPCAAAETMGFLYVATERGGDLRAQDAAALLAALRPVVSQAVQRKRAWDGLREVADAGTMTGGGGIFDWATHLIAAALKADLAFVGRVNLDFSASVTTLAACHGERSIGNFTYPLAPPPPERRRRWTPGYPPRPPEPTVAAPRPPARADELRPADAWLSEVGLEAWFGVPLFGSSGQVLGLVSAAFRSAPSDAQRIDATLRLVSERVASELRRLVAEEERAGLSAVVEAMTDLVATVRPSGYVSHLNRAGRRMLGLADGVRLPTLTLGTLLSIKPDAEALGLHVLDDANARGSWSETGVLERVDGGRAIDVTRLVLPIRDAEGRTSSYAVVVRDISERKAQEAQLLQTIAALAQSESLLEGVINNSSSLIYVKDPEGTYLLASERFRDFTGYTWEEIVGRKDADLFDPHAAASYRASDLSVIRTGEPMQSEDRVEGPNGPRVFLTAKFPLLDAAGQTYAVCGISTDITERKRAERENQELEAKLRLAQRMESIGQLSGGIAHDFNNILAAILGFAELAQMAAAENEAVLTPLEEILAATLRARDLVARLLAFSRRSEPPAEAIAVAPVVEEVVRMLRSTLPATIAIAVDLAQNLPAVRISPVQLHQVLMNLGINARDAMGRTGTLRVRADAVEVGGASSCASCHRDFQGDFVRLSVSDDGQGVRPEDVPRLFDPFFTTKEIGHGTGLGLSVLHGIVHSAGGHVEVDSQLGVGTEFRVYLPALPGGGLCAAPRGDDRPAARPLAARILVVDDEARIVAWQRLLFEGLGCTVAGFTDPAQALARFRMAPEAFDLVITDQTMPAVTGTALAAAVANERHGFPVILCSGHVSETVEHEARAAGVAILLEKLVTAARLIAAVREAVAENAEPSFQQLHELHR